MMRYRKVFRDHFDPRTGLRWFSADLEPVKRRFPVEKLPKIMMGIFAATYTVFWIYWAVTVALPALV